MKKFLLTLAMLLGILFALSAAYADELLDACPTCGNTDLGWYSVATADGKDAHYQFCWPCNSLVGSFKELCTPVEGSATCVNAPRCEVCGYSMSVSMQPDPNAHSWNNPYYSWNSLNSSSEEGFPLFACTAIRICGNYCGTVQQETVTASAVQTTPSTCSTYGVITYTASFEASWAQTQVNEQLSDPSDHTIVIDKAVEPTCTQTGRTEGSHCSSCGATIVAQEVIPATGDHAEWLDTKYYFVRETNDGGIPEYTGVAYRECAVCYTREEERVEASYTVTLEPTCTKHGELTYTAVFEAEWAEPYSELLAFLPVIDHTKVTDEAVEATCVETGLTEGSHCSVCGKILKEQKVVPIAEHIETVDEAVEPTCTKNGLTEGSHCSVCGKVLKEQEVVTAIGHKYKTKITVPTCTESGCVASICTMCGHSSIRNTISATLHWFDLWTSNEDSTHSAPCKRCAYIGTAACAALEVTVADGSAILTVCPVCGEFGENVFEVIEGAEMTSATEVDLPTGEAIIRGMEAPFDDVIYAFTVAYEYSGEVIPFGTTVAVSLPLSAEQFASFELVRVDVTAATETTERTEVRTAVDFTFENDLLTFEADAAALYLIIAK